MDRRIAWIDCGSGASGDMLLGALVAAGVPLEVLTTAVDMVAPESVELTAARVTRNGLAATHVSVDGTDSTDHRTWADVRKLLDESELDDAVRQQAHETFRRLAEAEAKVHGTTPDAIHFHEVGALDAIADVVGVCAGFAHLGLDAVSASPVAVGSGFVRAAHGRLPVPVPAVVELLAGAGAPSYAGETGSEAAPLGELCTPTGAALLTTHVTGWGGQPPMQVSGQGFGAGTREVPGRANVVRLVLGTVPDSAAQGAAAQGPPTSTQVVVESNVDDLDPRIWPAVLQRILAAGAADAWLTPILMKKGRPAHLLAVLVDPDRLDAVCQVIFTETSAIGVRSHQVRKQPLDREIRTVALPDGPVRVKVATHAGAVVNVQPEYDDVAALAERTGRPVKSVLAEAAALAQAQISGGASALD
ncbi:nickel pincer cofactor biosynthesis protein LarC [Actinopolymorpha sp. B9G3]|uniref:nickel pincer cofactor biosynthesis protein LarC n=1 Tax=Actinopolymorpha sp. B9G3 TaxID=3158970 RepID=UPI0032D943D0